MKRTKGHSEYLDPFIQNRKLKAVKRPDYVMRAEFYEELRKSSVAEMMQEQVSQE